VGDSLTPMLPCALLSLTLLAGASQAPPVVQPLLAADSSLRLLRRADVQDILDVASNARFSPFVRTDLTGDGIPDVAAVVVRPGPHAASGVLVFNGRRSGFGRAWWVVPPASERIAAVYGGDRRRLVIACCVACDSNPFVRWNGAQYESNLWLRSETPAAYDQPSGGTSPVALRAAATPTAR